MNDGGPALEPRPMNKTIRIKASCDWSKEAPFWAIVNDAMSKGEELEITIRRIPKPRRRQWIFTETGETRPPRLDEWYEFNGGIFKMSASIYVGPPTHILRLEEREVDA